MKETTRIYKIFDLINEEYIATGNYTQKNSWKVFPSVTIKQNKLDKDRYVVHEFKYELVNTKTFTLDKTEIKQTS